MADDKYSSLAAHGYRALLEFLAKLLRLFAVRQPPFSPFTPSGCRQKHLLEDNLT